MRDGGEFGELVSLLAAALVESGASVTSAEWEELREMSIAAGEHIEILESVTVTE